MSELDRVLASGRFDQVLAEVGERGELSPENARDAGAWLRVVAQHQPAAELVLMVGGYDDDPRSLWEIPEARDYLVTCLRAAGVADWRAPLVRRFSGPSIVLMAMCGILGADHPYTITIDPDASPL